MQKFGWIFLGLVVGLLVAQLDTPAPSTAVPTSQDWAKSGIDIVSTETDPAKQLAAAEAYYGKAVVLFLASLVNRTAPNTEVSKSVELAQADLAEPIVKEVSPETLAALQAQSKPERELTPKEKKAQEEALKQQANLDRMVAYRKSTPFNKLTPQVRKLQGYFAGTLKWESGKRKGDVDKFESRFDFSMQEGKLTGVFAITITNPQGEAYSRSRGDGDNRTLRAIEGQENKIYMEPAPGDFIILDIRNSDHFTGDYYDSDGAYVGKVQLWRG